jgi:polyhydroxyalkanoate synthase
MKKVTKAGTGPSSQDAASAKAGREVPATGNGMLSPGAIDALADIAKRTNRLAHLQAERLKSSDGYQVIHPKTVAATVRQFSQAAEPDPARLMQDTLGLWANMGLLWQRTATRFFFNTPVEPVVSPDAQDKRFKSELWGENHANDYVKQFYLLMSRYVQASVDSVKGIDPLTHHKMKFYTRQFLNAVSPTNFVATNPVVLKETMDSRGENLIKGFRNLVEDLERGGGRLSLKMADLSAFRFGENIAISPGKVVFRTSSCSSSSTNPRPPRSIAGRCSSSRPGSTSSISSTSSPRTRSSSGAPSKVTRCS